MNIILILAAATACFVILGMLLTTVHIGTPLWAALACSIFLFAPGLFAGMALGAWMQGMFK